MESGVSGQQFSRRVDRAVKQFCPSFMIVVYSSLSFLLFPFSSGFAARKKKQIPFIAGSLRTGARAVKGGGVCRLLEKSGNP